MRQQIQILFALGIFLFLSFASQAESLSDESRTGAAERIIRDANERYFSAIYKNNVDLVEVLLKAGVDINTRHENGKTGLMIASEKGSLSTVKLLIARGANKDLKFKEKFTARDLALAAKKSDIANLLTPSSPKASSEKP